MDARQQLKDQLKELEKEIDEHQPELLKFMEALGLQNMKVDGVGTVYLATNPYPKVHNMNEFIAWLDKEGEGAIAQRTVNAQTLKKWFRDRLEQGAELPDEAILDHFMDKEVRFRKG